MSLLAETPSTLVAMCEAAAVSWPQRDALIFDEVDIHITFSELDNLSNRVANALLELGVLRGDRVALITSNSPLFPIAWLGILKAGASMVPINPSYREQDAKHLVSHSEASIIICDKERAPLARQLKMDVSSVKALIVDSESEVEAGELRFSDRIENSSDRSPGVEIFPETLANVQFTSGTSGMPKGCMLSHRYWCELGTMIAHDILELTHEDVLLTAQPFSYIDPQWNLAAVLASGSSLVVLERFRSTTFWCRVAARKVTFFYCIGAMPLMLLAQPQTPVERAHRLRLVMCSGIPASRHAELEQRYGVPWREVFGTTETGADVMVYESMAKSLRGTGSIGKALPHRELRVAEHNSVPVVRGQVGELLIRGTGMMDGYFRNEVATSQAFADGWYHTGDLAVCDSDGTIRIVGRKKDMIRRSGENVAASEVEAVIEQHPKVLISAVTPIPDDLRGEEIKAYVVLKNSNNKSSFEIQGLIDFAVQRLARFKVPRYWELRDDLPRTPSERVAKHLIVTSEPGAVVFDRIA